MPSSPHYVDALRHLSEHRPSLTVAQLAELLQTSDRAAFLAVRDLAAAKLASWTQTLREFPAWRARITARGARHLAEIERATS